MRRALLVVLLLGACNGAAKKQLIADAVALDHATYPRATHVTPATPGTFGDAAAASIPKLVRLPIAGDLIQRPTDMCRVALDKDEPLPAVCHTLAEDNRASVTAMLLATHAAAAGLPPGLRAIPDQKDRLGIEGWPAVLNAARLAQFMAFDARLAGDLDGATRTCVDSIALGRDAGYGGSLLGAMMGAAVWDIAFHGCGAKLTATTGPLRTRAHDELVAIRKAMRPLSASMHEEAVVTALRAYGNVLDAKERTTLPPAALALVEHGAVKGAKPGVVDRTLLRDDLPRYRRYMDAIVAASDRPAAERDPLFAAAKKVREAEPNPLGAVATPALENYAKRYDDSLAALDKLIASLGGP